jgi:predicted acylesterase/phospholipase RssA
LAILHGSNVIEDKHQGGNRDMTEDFKFRLCFSGGGFRATFFCLGAYRRLVQLSLHERITSISSVSGGSIAAGQILNALSDSRFKSIEDFDERVTKPLVKIGQCRLRNRLMKKALYPASPRHRFSKWFPILLDDYLFNGKTFGQLPLHPEWSVNVTCLHTGKRFRFKQTDMGGNKIGITKNVSKIRLSFAVASSACYPMMFAPTSLHIKGMSFYKKWWTDDPVINNDPLPERLPLSDGGVYDNLGTEAILNYKEPFVTVDASGFLEAWPYHSKPNWFSLNWRPLDTGLEQIVLLRRRLIYQHSQKVRGIQLILRDPVQQLINQPERYGSLSNQSFDLPDYDLMTVDHQNLLGRLRTDLDGFHDIEIQSLIWAGSVKIDIAFKKYLSNLIDEQSITDKPQKPAFSEEDVTTILTQGIKRRYLKYVHRSLH